MDATQYTFHYTLAICRLEDRSDIPKLLGHRVSTTTRAYTHVLSRIPAGARSPINRLLEGR